MSDDGLRQLERRWKESGAPDDEVAYLRAALRSGATLEWPLYLRLAELDARRAGEFLLARVERGTLTGERLELAALLDDPGARSACPQVRPLSEHERLSVGIAAIAPLGQTATVRAIVALARRALQHWTHDETLPFAALRAAEAWCLSPGEPERARAAELADEYLAYSQRTGFFGAGEAASDAVEVAATDDPQQVVASLQHAAWAGANPMGMLGGPLDPALMLEAIRVEVVPWALGGPDPLASHGS